jgi:hypothetical protein
VLRSLTDRSNRGLLLDTVVLAVNLLGATLLMEPFVDLVRRAARDDPRALSVVFGLFVALFVLGPLGASLKRWHFHSRLSGAQAPGAAARPGGCLFNPIFYFCLAAVIFASINAFIMQRAFGGRDPGPAVFAASILIGIGLIVLHTFLVYRYFTPPKRPPRSAFLRGPASELIGDACLFTNMLLFQLIWNLLSYSGMSAPSGVVDFVARLLGLSFLALLLYFPPRMFYLAEDFGKARTWLSMLAANSPVIVRVLLGRG